MSARKSSVANAEPFMPAEGLALLERLAKNNSTAWFHAHKDEYTVLVREPMLRIVAAINEALGDFAPDYVTTKKDPVSRPNRDTRFSKDKSPYRTDVAAVFPRNGREKHEVAGFFIRIDPSGAELIAGTYMPGTEQLLTMRRYLAKNHHAFRKMATARPLTRAFGTLLGEQLVRVPAGFDADHPAGDLLRMKQFYLRRTLDTHTATSAKLLAEVVACFRAATPIVEEMDRVLNSA